MANPWQWDGNLESITVTLTLGYYEAFTVVEAIQNTAVNAARFAANNITHEDVVSLVAAMNFADDLKRAARNAGPF